MLSEGLGIDTTSNKLVAFETATFVDTPLCSIIASAICAPIRNDGFNDVIGS